jgi:hypothetical protein
MDLTANFGATVAKPAPKSTPAFRNSSNRLNESVASMDAEDARSIFADLPGFGYQQPNSTVAKAVADTTQHSDFNMELTNVSKATRLFIILLIDSFC